MSGTASSSTVGDFSVGGDVGVILIVNGYGRIDLGEVEGFSAKPKFEKPMIKPLNKRPIQKSIPAGYDLSLDLVRKNGSIERLMAFLESSYWGGQGIPVGTLYAYKRNTDGTKQTERYDNVSIEISDLGDFKTDAPVKQHISGFASGMTVV